MSQSPITIKTGSATTGHGDKWLLVERIVSSPQFRKTARLKDLLFYLAESSMRGEASNLTEQRIGHALFGKSADYSPVEDSSVRVHIRQLRLKLHEYFDSEGRDELLIVEIPKGSYALTFRSVPVFETEVLAPESPAKRRWHFLKAAAPWIAVAALSILSLVLWERSRAPAAVLPPWPLSAVFSNGHRSEIVLADCTYAIRQLLSGKPASLESYMRRDFQHRTDLTQPGNANNAFLAQYSGDALLTSWADVAIASTFLKLLPNSLERVRVRSARDLHPRDLEDGNFIFVGSPASNPWVLLFENRLNFTELRRQEADGEAKLFLNKRPRPGEQNTYEGLARTGLDGNDFATIALLPSESGRGNVLIIQGLQQEATEAAGMLLADVGGRKKLNKALGIETEPTSPLYFDVLLHVQAVGGSSKSASIVASRILKY